MVKNLVHSAKSKIGPFARGFWNLNQSIAQKNQKLAMGKFRYITDIEIAQYFYSKHLKSRPKRHEGTVHAKYSCFRYQKIFSIIDCKLLLYANFTKLKNIVVIHHNIFLSSFYFTILEYIFVFFVRYMVFSVYCTLSGNEKSSQCR